MDFFSLPALIIIGCVTLILFWAIAAYNKLVHFQALADEGWSGIDVQLKRRYDLIPNLVAVVKQYGLHEKEILEKVTALRSSSMSAQTVVQKMDAEQGLSSALKTLFAVAENYPNLKANENFLRLQDQLSHIENEIQLGRRYYNGAARNYNITRATFPTTLIALLFGFAKSDYFEIHSNERENPGVRF